MKKVLICILLLVVGWLIGWLFRPSKTETIIETQVDTLVRVDTHIIEKPVMVEKRIKDTVYVAVQVHDTTTINDTLYMKLAFETKTYKGEDYLAKVAGYNPSLYYIEVYPKTVTITQTQSVTNRNALALGFEMQYYRDNPYIPIYLEYSYLLHKNFGMYGKLLYDIPTQSVGVGLGIKAQIGW